MTAADHQEPRFGVDLTPAHLMALRPQHVTDARRFASGAQSSGGRVVQRAGRGQEVFDLRAFVDGDDPRHLDHRATARKGRPHIKRYHEERNTKLLLVLDLRPAMFFGLNRAFLAFAAAEHLIQKGWAHLANQGHVGLYAFTNTREVYLRPRPRDHAMQMLIGELCALYAVGLAAAAEGVTSQPLDDRLAGVINLGERGTSVTVASGFDRPGKQIQAVLAQLRHRQHLTALYMSYGNLANLPAGTYPVANDRSERSELSGFKAPSLPPYLNAERGDLVVDAGAGVEAGFKSSTSKKLPVIQGRR